MKANKVLKAIEMVLNENESAPYTDKFEIIRVMKEAVKNGENEEIQTQHIENIRNMVGKHRIFE